MRALLAPLREAAWLNAERATIAGWMLLAGLVFIVAYMLGTSQNGINSRGVPIGGDFTATSPRPGWRSAVRPSSPTTTWRYGRCRSR